MTNTNAFKRLCPKSALCGEDVPTQRREGAKRYAFPRGFLCALAPCARNIRRYMRHGYFSGKPLSSVLRSKRAITVNIEIVRAFVKLRQLLASNSELSRRLDELESKYDKQFRVVFVAIRQLMATPVRDSKEIGFRSRAVKR